MSTETTLILMSDNHGMRDGITYILDRYPQASYYLHCGDLCMPKEEFPQLVVVRGNNDFDRSLIEERVVTLEKHRIFMTHGTQIGNREDLLLYYAKKNKCDIILTGHTHIPVIKKKEGILMVNPGSLCYNRDGSLPSYIFMKVKGDQVKCRLERIDKDELNS